MPSLADLIQFCFAGITMGATYGLVAVGFNVIFNATGAVNFAQGEFAMLGGMLGAALLTWSGLPLPAVIVLTVLAVTAIGVLLERLAIKPARGADILNLIIITIGASILLKGAVMVTLGKNAAGLPAFTGERPPVDVSGNGAAATAERCRGDVRGAASTRPRVWPARPRRGDPSCAVWAGSPFSCTRRAAGARRGSPGRAGARRRGRGGVEAGGAGG